MTLEGDNNIITFGCRLNAYESEAIKEAVAQTNEKNLIVFNSCAVTAKAERDLRQSLKKARRQNPDAKIVVTGCAAQIDPAKYAKMEEVNLVLGNDEKSKAKSYDFSTLGADNNVDSGSKASLTNSPKDVIHKDKIFFASKKNSTDFLKPEETAKIRVNDIMSLKETAPQLVSYFENRTRAFLEIQNGCNHRCTFCIIPFGRGNSRSVAFGDIVTQVKKMLAKGHQEIVLTGVDISGYGSDLDVPITLTQMIRRLLKLVPELPRLRLSSIDVAEIDEDFLDLLKNEPRLMPYLHLSLQSGDDLILKRMQRRHNRQELLDFCIKTRKIRPDITFGADIIAGFPTENEENFQNSLNLIKEANIIFTHIFPYSKREGTPAAKMPQISGKIIKERAKMLRQAGEIQLKTFLQAQIGKKIEVIVEKDGMSKSQNFLDVKIIDNNKLKAGDIVEVKVVGFEGGYLVAT